MNLKIENEALNKNWKNQNTEYLHELQKFMDKVDNVQDEKLRLDITYQMLKCDEVLTNIAEERFEECYKKGLKDQQLV